jgi:large subunit ribosomal protein L1
MKRGKKYVEAAKLVDRTKAYTALEALELAVKTSTAKFDASVDVSFRLNIDPRKAEQNIRGAIVLPNGTGKTRKVLVICRGAKQAEATEAGADYVGEAEVINKIQQGWFDFDIIVATPDMMGQLGKLGRVLGPKGLMPNPKLGTVTTNVADAISNIKKGMVEFKNDSYGNVHVSIGKLSFKENQLEENLRAMIAEIVKSKPTGVKGAFIKNVSLSSTMGPGIKLSKDSLGL